MKPLQVRIVVSGSMSQPTALVIGASGGIGAAVTRRFIENGYAVSGTTRNSEIPEGANRLIVDVADRKSIEQAVRDHLSAYESLDTLVYCAGITRDNILLRMSDSDIHDVLDINLVAPMQAVRAALKPMLRQGGGSIVLISSMSARYGVVGQSNYTASKAGLESFARSEGKAWAAKKIRINTVAPGPTDTPMLNALDDATKASMIAEGPSGRAASPDEVARVVFDVSEWTAVSGATIPISGGGGYGY